MLLTFEIKSESVRQYHDYLIGVYKNESIDKEHRHGVARRIEVVQNLVKIFEQGENLNFEDLTWVELGSPLLPEEKREWMQSLLKEEKREHLRLVK